LSMTRNPNRLAAALAAEVPARPCRFTTR
jgi:hypothetical protein